VKRGEALGRELIWALCERSDVKGGRGFVGFKGELCEVASELEGRDVGGSAGGMMVSGWE
jgi:hypothetical protein